MRTALGKQPQFGPMTIAIGAQLLSQPGLEEQLTSGNPGRQKIAAQLTNGATGCAARCECGVWQVAIWDPDATYIQMWDRRFGGGVKKHVKCCALVGQEDSVRAERPVGGAEAASPAALPATDGRGVAAVAGEQQGAAKQAASVRQKPVKRPSVAVNDGGEHLALALSTCP